jgi:heme exporter protein D
MLDLDMAQYGPFVWSAWGISAAVLIGLVVGVLRRANKAARALREAEGDDRA